ncbi:enoyl-CoA hydratase-related protein [uncultured Phenylobacterium sp.]|uniref:enoyl-CoA hydratase/isomerase family protein n=1 Tax=uncultured Phenylobacterium sp. TaxID=349273 RepID=UPI0025DD5441|nr:enoyl-CoA hydratase-related protein [uncultured Phenylobacterium sp.]
MTDEPMLVAEALEGGLERLTMNRPARLNALNHPMAEALLAHFESRRRDEDTRVILLCGAGRAFCSGADLKASGQPDALRDGPKGDWVLRDLMKAMRACPQPVISLVRGAAAGGGLALALASDIIVASETAAFHTAFINVGLSGAELGASWKLQRMIGVSRAREMLYTGRPLKAADALTQGLVSAVVPDAELEAYGEALARDMLRAQPDALRLSKRSFDATLDAISLEAALELEERAQMLMIARRGQA